MNLTHSTPVNVRTADFLLFLFNKIHTFNIQNFGLFAGQASAKNTEIASKLSEKMF